MIIDEMRGEKSINQIINEWLWSKAVGDGADRVADSLRPALALMDDADREEFVASAITVVEALTRAGRRQRRKG
ncbi:hypothetical protein [Phyllobacterium phragmitis]|uniref:hypothetical protein n=1 Tax=Phyllobacterium phragmitis TaxID=2670329 RepID=UPI0011B25085|nr:hypothetical protein [Phyllobacterium phragmitis]